jgi:hypothetical protein
MGVLPNEIPKDHNTGVLIALACSGRLITPELVIAMTMQPIPTHMNPAYLCVKGKKVEEAREILADTALSIRAKYLWFVDDDTIPPPNTCRRLMYVLDNNPDVMVCGGVYVTKSDPPQPVVFRGMGLGSFWHWKEGEIFEVTGMGAGCMMINCEVFKHLEKPYFPWVEEYTNEATCPMKLISEDIGFCNKVRAAGFKVFAHGGVLCDHFDCTTGETYRLLEDSYPLKKDISSVVPPLEQQKSTKE